MYIALRVMCLLILSYFNQNRNVLMNVYENPSSRSRAFPCGQTDMTGLVVASRRCFAKVPKSTAYSILCAQRVT